MIPAAPKKAETHLDIYPNHTKQKLAAGGIAIGMGLRTRSDFLRSIQV